MSFKITIENKHRGCAVVLAALDVFMRQLGATRKETDELKIAVKEAVENAVEFAYPDKEDKKITVEAKCNGSKVTIKVTDKGVGISNLKKALLPLKTTRPVAHTGMGFTIMQSFTDGITVKSNENGTTVTLTKCLK